jgi:hypothetical protein
MAKKQTSRKHISAPWQAPVEASASAPAVVAPPMVVKASCNALGVVQTRDVAGEDPFEAAGAKPLFRDHGISIGSS